MSENEAARKILVVNSGSSSLKYSVFDWSGDVRVAHGDVERIGAPGTRLVQRGPRGEVTRALPQGDYADAFAAMLRELCAPETGALRDAGEIGLVGHRVVHGGERFPQPTVIDDDVLRAIDALAPLAPLHNPVDAAGIREARRLFPAATHVAVFDTSFHHTLPPHAYLYGLPYEYYERKGIRRYGFHGTSHAYVSSAAAQHLGRALTDLKSISCHLGNGASLCAIDRGRSVDTSMGFTPGEGLIMGTRCGDLDPGVLLHLQREDALDAAQAEELLNDRSGLLGLSGVSSDMRGVERAADSGNARAQLALQAFSYRVRKYIGAYVAALGGLDILIFTGGIGQGSARVRTLAMQGLGCLGIDLDAERNRDARGFDEICRVSTDASPVTVLVVPTDEEAMIARESLRAVLMIFAARRGLATRESP